MIIVYRAANIADAHLIRQLLESEGIPAFIQGEYLQGAVGELPANTEILVSVADERADAALEMIKEWQAATPVELEDGPDEAATQTSRAGGISGFGIIALLLGGAVAGAGLLWMIQNRPSDGPEIDIDGDGRIDERLFMAGDRVAYVEYDRNRDGKADEISHYAMDRFVDKVESDNDFDGRFETVLTFRNNKPDRWIVDDDLDRHIDSRGEYLMGVIYQEEWLDRDGNVVKRVTYDNGIPLTGEIDSDADGKLDTARRYDKRGEIVESKPLTAK